MNRREFMHGLFAAGACGGFSLARWVEPNWIEVTHRKVRLGNSQGKTIRLVHLSDLHYSKQRSLDRIRRAVDLALEAEPQVVCVTGDFIDSRMPKESPYREVLERLTRYVPTLGVVGNHDGGTWAGRVGGYSDASLIYEFARSAGLLMLENESVPNVKGRDGSLLGINFVGVGDLWSGNLDANEAFKRANADSPVVLLSHNPDSKDALRNFGWDLMLSGHTHGGQIVIPFTDLAPVAPIGDGNFVEGLCPWGERQVHVNRGIGSLFDLRFNCRPEVSVLELEV